MSPRPLGPARRWRYRAASFWRRLLADVVDLSILGLGLVGLWRAGFISEPLPEIPGDLLDQAAELLAVNGALTLPAVAATLTLGLLYGSLSRAALHGTPGERCLGLRLLDPTGEPAGPVRAALHGVAQLIGLAIFGFGYLWAIVDVERRTLAEHLTGARLVQGIPELEAARPISESDG